MFYQIALCSLLQLWKVCWPQSSCVQYTRI